MRLSNWEDSTQHNGIRESPVIKSIIVCGGAPPSSLLPPPATRLPPTSYILPPTSYLRDSPVIKCIIVCVDLLNTARACPIFGPLL